MTPLHVPPPRPAPRGRAAFLEQLRDRWAEPRVRAGVLIAVAAVAGLVWYQVVRSDSSALAAPARSPRTAHRAPTTTTRPPVLVHVAGAVVHPGLVRVATGARVADAITAAGGPVPDADLDRLNLAAKVADGQRILVVVRGAAGSEPAAGSGASGGGADASGGAPADGAPVNLNTATVADLDGLPGIGPTLAAAILRERERRGGFTSIEQLRDVRGIGEKRFADLKGLVTV